MITLAICIPNTYLYLAGLRLIGSAVGNNTLGLRLFRDLYRHPHVDLSTYCGVSRIIVYFVIDTRITFRRLTHRWVLHHHVLEQQRGARLSVEPTVHHVQKTACPCDFTTRHFSGPLGRGASPGCYCLVPQAVIFRCCRPKHRYFQGSRR